MKKLIHHPLRMKIGACLYAASTGKMHEECAKDLGINVYTLKGWIKKYEEFITHPELKDVDDIVKAIEETKARKKEIGAEERIIRDPQNTKTIIDCVLNYDKIDKHGSEATEFKQIADFKQINDMDGILVQDAVSKSYAPENAMPPQKDEDIVKLKLDISDLRSMITEMQDTQIKIMSTVSGILSTQQSMLASQAARQAWKPHTNGGYKTQANGTNPKIGDEYDQDFNRKY